MFSAFVAELQRHSSDLQIPPPGCDDHPSSLERAEDGLTHSRTTAAAVGVRRVGSPGSIRRIRVRLRERRRPPEARVYPSMVIHAGRRTKEQEITGVSTHKLERKQVFGGGCEVARLTDTHK